MKQRFIDLNDWCQTPLGKKVISYLSLELEKILPYWGGRHLLQLGIEEQNAWLSTSPISHCHLLMPFSSQHKQAIKGDLYQFPFDEKSIDALLMPFTLDLIQDKSRVLQEANRILKGSGALIICGINLFSLWGMRACFPPNNNFIFNAKELINPYKLTRILNHHDFDMLSIKWFYYSPPIQLKLKNERFFEYLGKMLLPYPAGFYCLVAQKIELMAVRPYLHYGPLVIGKGLSPTAINQ